MFCSSSCSVALTDGRYIWRHILRFYPFLWNAEKKNTQRRTYKEQKKPEIVNFVRTQVSRIMLSGRRRTIRYYMYWWKVVTSRSQCSSAVPSVKSSYQSKTSYRFSVSLVSELVILLELALQSGRSPGTEVEQGSWMT